MKKISKDTWVFIFLIAFIVLAMVFMGDSESEDSGPEVVQRATSYSSKPSGVKALYETLDRLGYPVRRKTSQLTEAPEDGVLFILSPSTSPGTREWSEIKRWVERGNVLVVASQTDSDLHRDWDHQYPKCPSFLTPQVKSQVTVPVEKIDEDMETLDDVARFIKPDG